MPDYSVTELTELQRIVVSTMTAWGLSRYAGMTRNAWMHNQQIDPPKSATPLFPYPQFLADFAECNRQALNSEEGRTDA